MRRRATWERSWTKFLQPAALALLAVMLLALAGCNLPITQKPNESNSDFRQRQNLELHFSRWGYRPQEVTDIGYYVVTRIIDLPPSLWDSWSPLPPLADFSRGETCTEHGKQAAQEGAIGRMSCFRLRQIDKDRSCRMRGHSKPRCVDVEAAPGLISDTETKRRLELVAKAPCRTFSHRRRPTPPPRGIPYADLSSNLQQIEAVFICNRDQSDGIWIFRLAFTDIESGEVFLFPDDFGGKVVE